MTKSKFQIQCPKCGHKITVKGVRADCTCGKYAAVIEDLPGQNRRCGTCAHAGGWRDGHGTCTAQPVLLSRLPACVELMAPLGSIVEMRRHPITPNGGHECELWIKADARRVKVND